MQNSTSAEAALGSDAKANSYRYEGFYQDAGIGTYDMQARPYRPQSAQYLTQDRFQAALGDQQLAADPLTQNRYAFAGGNPTSNVEYDGHCTFTATCSPAQNAQDNARESAAAKSAAAKSAFPSYVTTGVSDGPTTAGKAASAGQPNPNDTAAAASKASSSQSSKTPAPAPAQRSGSDPLASVLNTITSAPGAVVSAAKAAPGAIAYRALARSPQRVRHSPARPSTP